MTTEDIEKAAAVLFAWQERGRASVNEAIGVLLVLRNRVAAGMCEGSWLANIESLVNEDEGGVIATFPDTRNPQFIQIRDAVESVYDGTRRDSLTDGATMFAPTWKELPQRFVRSSVVGNTVFFKETPLASV